MNIIQSPQKRLYIFMSFDDPIHRARYVKEKRREWRNNFFGDNKAPKEYKPFAFTRPWGFGRSPEWLMEERKARAETPDPTSWVHAITLSLLSPTGKEYSYKWYLPKKKNLTLEDFARCVKSFEDRHLIYLEKTALCGLVVDTIYKEKDLVIGEKGYLKKIRLCDNPYAKTNTQEES